MLREVRGQRSEVRRVAAIFSLISGICFLTSGCSLAPDFKMPDMQLPTKFKEQQQPPINDGSWKIGVPAESVNRGEWWKIFGDPQLDNLEAEAAKSSQSLKAATARVQQSRAIMRVALGDLFPEIDLGGNALRSKPAAAAGAAYGIPATQFHPYTLYSAGGTISYEADLFGSGQDNYRAAKSDAASSEAVFQSVLLALQADVAQNYFAIRTMDADRVLLRDTVKIREEAERIMGQRFNAGDVGEQDYVRAQTELASARADLIALDKQRADTDHALALLLGKLPTEFTLAEMPLTEMPPVIPAGLPSSLLERRPDIASAQNQMASANSRIGVARAAFFPKLNLTGSGGFESVQLQHLFQWSSRTWALGPLFGTALTVPVFDGGKNFANLDLAKSGYEESVANYRQQVLVAFREVEDNLNDQRLLAEQLKQQDIAAKAARRSAELSRHRYDEGESDYFEVVDEERTSLAAQRAEVEVKGARFATTVTLIRALGGGWEIRNEVHPE